MVYGDAGRVRFRYRYLCCDSLGDAGTWCCTMVDPNLEQRRLRPVERGNGLHRAVTNGCGTESSVTRIVVEKAWRFIQPDAQ